MTIMVIASARAKSGLPQPTYKPMLVVTAAIRAESLYHLYDGSFREMYRLLRKGKLAVVVSEMDITGFAKDAGFRIIDEYSQRVHRSLTRRI